MSRELKRSGRISKEWEESEMDGHARIDERMDENVSRNFMTELTVDKAGGSWRG